MTINKKIGLILSLLLFCSVAQSKEMDMSKKEMKHKNHDHKKHDHKKHDHKDQKASLKKTGKDKLTLKVKGMVCAFCAQGIEKNFNKQKQVKSTKVNLDNMEVTIKLHPGKSLSEKKIKKIVTDAGFGFDGIKE